MRADKRHVAFSPMAAGQVIESQSASTPTFQFQMASAVTKKLQETESPEELIAIKKDLMRTIILAAIAISTEFALYVKFYR